MKTSRILRYAILTILSALFLCCGILTLTADASSSYVVIGGQTITPDGQTRNLFGGQVSYSYTNGRGTLYLTNVTIDSTQPHAIEIDAPSTIILTGNNTITHTYHRSESDPGAAIYTDYRCTIAGDASLTINADDDAAIYVNDSLTIEGATLTVHANSRNATCGIYARNDLKIDFATVTVDGNARYGTYDRGTMTITDKSVVRAEGRTYGIYQGVALGDHSNGTLLIEDSTVIARGGTYGIMSNYQKVTGFFYDYDGSNIRVSGMSDVYAYGGINSPKRPDKNTLKLSPSQAGVMFLETGSNATNARRLSHGMESTYRMKDYIDYLDGVLNQFNYVHIYDTTAMQHVNYQVVFNLGTDVEQPRSITLQLLRDDTIVAQKDASEVEGWASKFYRGRDPRLSGYRITATVPEGYSYTATETSTNNWTITVTGGKAVTIDANVDISFDLIDGAVEPEYVQLVLEDKETATAPRTVGADAGWHYTFSNVVKKAAERGEYSLKAWASDQSYHVDVYGDPINGYKVVVCGGKVAPTPEPEPEPEIYDVDLEATFTITEGAEYPDQVRVNLVKDGEIQETVELVEALDWKGAFRDLLLESKEDYQIEVEAIDGYSVSGEWNDDHTAYTISVSGGTPVTVDATVITDWDLASPYARPDSITLNLYKGDDVVRSVTLPQDGDNWQTTFTGLLKNLADDYHLVAETNDDTKWHVEVDGDPIRGYRLTVSGGDENLTHVDVETGWALDEGAEKPNITIYLMQNGKILRTEVLEEDNDWSVSFTNVPKAEIDSYDVVVASIPDGYRYSISGDARTGYLIAVTGGGSPTPTPTERHEDVSYSDGECRHDYQWETYKEATATEDGEMRYRCRYCGDVQYSVPVTAYYTFNKETQEKVLKAEQNATVKVQTPWFISFHEMVYKALQERSDVTLVVDYKNEDALYEMTIPAGSGDQLQGLFGDSQFAGFLYLGGTYATTQLPDDTVFDGLTATEMWFGTTTAH